MIKQEVELNKNLGSDKSMNENILVIGGGIIGASTAYYLASKGKKVTLLERDDICAGTSSACDQAVLLQTKKPGPLLKMAIESARIYEKLEKVLDQDIEYKKGGGLILFESKDHRSMMQQLVLQQQKAGLDVEVISAKEAHQKQVGLNDHVVGATWSSEDAKVNSYKTTYAFINAAVKLGAEVYTNKNVKSILVKNGKIQGVKTDMEIFYSNKVILATGVWTAQLLKKMGISVPIKPRKGHILVTEKLPPIVHSNILSASYIAAKSGASNKKQTKAQLLGVGLVMGQTKSGNILIGGSREFVGFDRKPTPEVINEIRKALVRLFPQFNGIRIIRSFAGLRPYTPDSLPIIDKVQQIEGLYINAGHEGDGIALAPISGKLMSEIVCNEKPSIDTDAVKLSRFK